jgi:hypothetical protein
LPQLEQRTLRPRGPSELGGSWNRVRQLGQVMTMVWPAAVGTDGLYPVG